MDFLSVWDADNVKPKNFTQTTDGLGSNPPGFWIFHQFVTPYSFGLIRKPTLKKQSQVFSIWDNTEYV